MPLSMAIDARRSSEDGTSTHLSTSTILIVLVRIENHAHHIFSLIIGYLEKFISSSAAGHEPHPYPVTNCCAAIVRALRALCHSYYLWLCRFIRGRQHSYWPARNYAAKSCSFDFNRSKVSPQQLLNDEEPASPDSIGRRGQRASLPSRAKAERNYGGS